MKASEIKATNPLYDQFLDQWDFFGSVYDGIDAMIENGVISQHERETLDNFAARKDEAFSFGYCKSIVDIFNYYLHEKSDKNNYEDLQNDELFGMFLDDCDLYGTSWGQFLRDQQRNASIYGHMGILIDKGRMKTENMEQAKEAKLYPYVAAFSPQCILDWQYERNEETSRPELAMVKLQENDNTYLIWYKDRWERYILDEKNKEAESVIPDSFGDNPLGVVPFVWLYNVKHREKRNIGVSDLNFIGYVESSIVRNMSHGEEVIKYGAFPIKRTPKKRVLNDEGDDDVGPTAVWEFDPAMPESKPDWLTSAVGEPITAILSWINLKITEIYRASNTGGVAQTAINSGVKSGDALRREFQMLNSMLVSKAMNEVEAEKGVVYLWCKWQNNEDAYDKITIERSEDYSISDLETELANALTAKTLITVDTFRKELMKRMSRMIMPGIPEELQEKIDKEIDEQEKPDMSGLIQSAGGINGENEDGSAAFGEDNSNKGEGGLRMVPAKQQGKQAPAQEEE